MRSCLFVHLKLIGVSQPLLDLMSENLRRLRGLGQALGTEVDDQNKLLDSLAVKADKTDTVVRDQDKQMKRILGFKAKKIPEKDESGK